MGSTHSIDSSRGFIKLALIHCHSESFLFYQHLVRNWSRYGKTRIILDSFPHFTLETLRESSPDILVCSDIAGSPYQLSQQELTDLETYVQNGVGHHLLGTYALFYHKEDSGTYDNRRLASLFGRDPAMNYKVTQKSTFTSYQIPSECSDSLLWKGILQDQSYTCLGWKEAQIPVHDTWDRLFPSHYGADPPISNETEILAQSTDHTHVILEHRTKTYNALYISNMPEYKWKSMDVRFIYNACLYLTSPHHCSLYCLCLKTLDKSCQSYPLDDSLPEEVRLQLLGLSSVARIIPPHKNTIKVTNKNVIQCSQSFKIFGLIGILCLLVYVTISY